jgi:hypothetical protein
MAATPDGRGYWLVASDGGIFAFGDAQFEGSAGSLTLNEPVDGMAATGDGGIFNYGSAQIFSYTTPPGNSAAINNEAVGIATGRSSGGYWVATAQGDVDAGYAPLYGSLATAPAAPVVGIASTSSGYGYWTVGSDGGVFAFGNAAFDGSMGGHPLNRPIVGIAGS